MIRITSKKDGFRRCGIAHPATPTEYPDGHFKKAVLAELQAEPMLTVELVKEEPVVPPIDPEPAQEKKKGKG
jgi:hypothetical protein